MLMNHDWTNIRWPFATLTRAADLAPLLFTAPPSFAMVRRAPRWRPAVLATASTSARALALARRWWRRTRRLRGQTRAHRRRARRSSPSPTSSTTPLGVVAPPPPNPRPRTARDDRIASPHLASPHPGDDPSAVSDHERARRPTVLLRASETPRDGRLRRRDGRRGGTRANASPDSDGSPTLRGTDASVEDVLKPLEGRCFYRIEGWWTYEFCHRRRSGSTTRRTRRSSANEYKLGTCTTPRKPPPRGGEGSARERAPRRRATTSERRPASRTTRTLHRGHAVRPHDAEAKDGGSIHVFTRRTP